MRSTWSNRTNYWAGPSSLGPGQCTTHLSLSFSLSLPSPCSIPSSPWRFTAAILCSGRLRPHLSPPLSGAASPCLSPSIPHGHSVRPRPHRPLLPTLALATVWVWPLAQFSSASSHRRHPCHPFRPRLLLLSLELLALHLHEYGSTSCLASPPLSPISTSMPVGWLSAGCNPGVVGLVVV